MSIATTVETNTGFKNTSDLSDVDSSMQRYPPTYFPDEGYYQPDPVRNNLYPNNNTTDNLPREIAIMERIAYHPTFTACGLPPNTSSTILCAFPGVCQGSTSDIYQKCFNTTLLDCEECGRVRGSLFLTFAICLGLAIFVGNALIMCVGYKRHKEGKTNKFDICRSSLAVADMMTGIQVLVLTVYNFSWSMNLTACELDRQQLALRGTPQAFVAGILFFFGITSSLYHLVYMGLERFYAIMKPFQYRTQSKSSIYIGITVVWILSLMNATFPTWFSTNFTFTYLPSTFLFSPTLERTTVNPDFTSAIIVLCLFYVLPYIVLSAALLGTDLTLRRSKNSSIALSKKRSRSKSSGNQDDKNNKQHISRANVTLAIMQVGFTITLIPYLVVGILYYSKYLDCSSISKSYLAAVFVRVLNSFLNIVIYNIRDKDFRSDVSEFVKSNFLKSESIGLSSRTT